MKVSDLQRKELASPVRHGKKAVVIVSHNLVRNDGQGRVLFELARGFRERGWAVTGVAHRFSQELAAQGVAWISVPVSITRPILFKAPLFSLAANRILSADFKRSSSRIIGNGYSCTVEQDINIAHFVHGGSSLSGGPTSIYEALYRRCNAVWERKSFNAAKRVVAPSHFIGSRLEEIGVDGNRIVLIPHGVDTVEFHPEVRREGSANKTPIALFVGDLRNNRKGFDLLLSALSRVPNMCVWAVGQLDRSPFPKLVQRLGLQDRVRFLGFQSNVSEIMAQADVFVFPSRYDPFALVLLEAMAAGLPVITSRLAGAGELLTPQAGIVLDSLEGADALVEALTALFTDKQRRRSMALAARRIAEANSWSGMVDRYCELLGTIDR